MTVAEVRLWGRPIGAVTVDGPGAVAAFQYTEPFRRSGIEVAPLMMPLASKVYRFPGLAERSFRGLPGMLADSLPDKFGTAVIDAWLAAQGRLPNEIDAVERLCYTGKRGMGALEFEPAQGPQAQGYATSRSRSSRPLFTSELRTSRGETPKARATWMRSSSSGCAGSSARRASKGQSSSAAKARWIF